MQRPASPGGEGPSLFQLPALNSMAGVSFTVEGSGSYVFRFVLFSF